MSDYIGCPGCDKQLKRLTSKPEKYRKHQPFKAKGDTTGDGFCDFGGTVIPEEECKSLPTPDAPSKDASSAKSSTDDAPASAPSATPTTSSSPGGQDREADASTASAPDALPGVDNYAKELGELSERQTEVLRERVEAGLTPFSQPTPPDYERPTLFSQAARYHLDDGSECSGPDCGHYDQPVAVGTGTATPESSPSPVPPPASSFSQPAGRRSEQPEVEMSTDAASIAARVKELFYAYDNRRSADNRSAQATMGPSEMGTPCDRRLALSLMRMPPVNPGGDGWAAFVGTAIHASLEQMFVWADAGTGRFATEQRLEFGSVFVPKGTADLIDRTLFMVLDHKCQGRWSRNKLKTQGPSSTYRVQAHVYAHGARLRGERIEKVAIISWPRDEATLDDLYVHVEDYNPLIVKQAFERVEKIGTDVKEMMGDLREAGALEAPSDEHHFKAKATVAAGFTVADDCRFCPFYLPNARDITRGCNGKR